MKKFHRQHIIIVVKNDRYFKSEGKTSPRDHINKAGLEYILFYVNNSSFKIVSLTLILCNVVLL